MFKLFHDNSFTLLEDDEGDSDLDQVHINW